MKQFCINFSKTPEEKIQILPFLCGRKWQEKCAKKSPAAMLQGKETMELFLLDLQLAAGNLRTKGILVGKESSAGLLTEQAGTNHLAEQRMRMIFRVTGFLIHVGQVSEDVIQANQVSRMQRANLHAGTELHCAVNVRGACDVVRINADSFVDLRDQDTVDNKAGAFVYHDGALVALCDDVMYGINDCIICADGAGYLNQLHDMCRVEEVHTEDAGSTVRHSTGNFRDRQGRGVGADDAVFVQNGIQHNQIQAWQ